MNRQILKSLDELVEARVIDADSADRIRQYFVEKQESSPQRLMTAFGVLGAAITGLGIILIIAHNWDQLSRVVKTVIAFLPLVAGQALCGYVLLKKRSDTVWKESAPSFLFFAVGASVSLVSQIYQIPGDISAFLLTWMALIFPLMYLFQSGAASLLYLAGITVYVCIKGYVHDFEPVPWAYWPLLALAAPHYVRLIRRGSAFAVIHHWLIPVSAAIALGTIARHNEVFLFVGYMSLFGVMYLIGKKPFMKTPGLAGAGYLLTGALGSLVVLFMLSFSWFWRDLASLSPAGRQFLSGEAVVSALITLAALALAFYHQKKEGVRRPDPLAWAFLIFFLAFIAGLFSTVWPVILVNATIFLLGLYYAVSGARQGRLTLLNFGMSIIAVLAACRFFDTGLSFVARGILFIIVGFGFFLANYRALKRKKERAKAL